MLSYRHSYHAGNHADLIKHLVQTLLIEKLKTKDKPFIYIDTHSGGGLYDLASEQANKTGEYHDGIAKLVNRGFSKSMPLPFAELVRELNADQKKLRFYPGSPLIAQKLLRPQDKLLLMELHSKEVEVLQKNLQGDRRTRVLNQDGFASLIGALPPKPARGMVLIDPSYELKEDYYHLVETITDSVKRWPTGTFAIWYPILGKQRDRSGWLLRKLEKICQSNLLVAELTVDEQQPEFGMHGSGMAIINAPYQLDQNIEKHLELIHPKIAKNVDGKKLGGWKIQWIKESN
ncbi:23S rRNA (adenine(2030)-N(6))-methyltransferase RlmJ [Pelagibaculum spongiae]|uniref:Ribosomal RNA large subunit methyltransferase J n=1 Tax=Pelagibaculum spongiae TaxID=2080658 RepID=A0A2V1GZK4_9GAMM|nr:23S rRNA (adenine(2030)-N(6))-methyltransferase RlmJ [Pelagibaculum spongiae]